MPDLNRAYTPPEWGRRQIMTDVTSITKENISEVVSKGYYDHQDNVKRIKFLFDYDAGIQPIMKREKTIRSEINEKVSDNMAAKIVNTHANYCFGRPVTFVQRAKVELGTDGPKSKADGERDDASIAVLNKMNQEQKKGSKDFALARDFLKCGLGYMMAYPCRQKRIKKQFAPFELMVLNPMTTFVVYSNDAYRDPMVAVTYFTHADGTISLTAYTDQFVYEVESSTTAVNGFRTTATTPNVLGLIPIVEFSLWDRTGVFERAIPLMDALNLLNSDRVNDVCQFVQSLLWLHNCELDEEGKDQLVDGDGVIMTQSTEGKEAKITYLTQTLNQSEQQTFVDYLKQEILELCCVPSWQEASGGSTTGAMQLSNGWQSLEIFANAIEERFDEAEEQLLAVELAIIQSDRNDFGDLEDLEVPDIEIKFCRSKNYDLVSKTNSLVSLINAGVDGLTAFNTVNLFTDPQQAWVDSADVINAIQKNLAKEKEETDPNSGQNRNAFADTDAEGNGGANNEPKDPTEASLQPSQAAEVEEDV